MPRGVRPAILTVLAAVAVGVSVTGIAIAVPAVTASGEVIGRRSSIGALFGNGGSDCTSSSTPNGAEEAATLALADPWLGDVDAAGRTRLSVAPFGVAGSSANGATISFPGTGVTATLTRREISAADAAPGTGAVGSAAGSTTFSNTVRLEDCAPRPDDLTASGLPAGMDLIGGDVNLSGTVAGRARYWSAAPLATPGFTSALIVFSEPIAAFGAWFGDLETRPAEPGPTQGGVLARVKLFAGDPTAGPAAELAAFPVPTSTPTGACGSIAAPVDDLAEDGTGCGNQATRFIGFHDPAGASVRAMLVIVGEDDTCPPVALPTGCNGDTESLSWLAPILAVTPADLTIDKTPTSAGPVDVGDLMSWDVDVTNTGETATTGAPLVTDDLPGGLRLVSAAGGGWNCSASTDTSVSCRATGAFAAGETGTIAVTAAVMGLPDGFPGSTTYVNIATVAWDGSSTDSAPSSRRLRNADLSIVKAGPARVRAGGTIVWTLRVRNAGPDTAAAVRVVDRLPTGTTLVSAAGAGWSCSSEGRVVTCRHAGPLPAPSALEPITIRARVAEGLDADELVNAAQVSSRTADPAAADAIDTLAVSVVAAAPTPAPSPAAGGETAGTGTGLRAPAAAMTTFLLLGVAAAFATRRRPEPAGRVGRSAPTCPQGREPLPRGRGRRGCR